MKGKTGILFCLSLLILYPLITTKFGNNDQFFTITRETHNVTLSDGFYDESPPIGISNNTDFVDQASANSWDGNGSLIDPYIIEGYNITTETDIPILIGNTSVFFEVRGCLLVKGSTGILLQNVTNGKIWNNTIRYSVNNGILVTESNNVIITNNTISEVNEADSTGVYSLGSNYCEISNNTISAVSGWDILVDYSHNCSITHNNLSLASYDGIRLRDSSDNNITLNEIRNSHLSGIKLGNSQRCRIERNIVEHSTTDGISTEVSSNSQIIDNILYESGGYSLDISGDSTEIIANTFYRSQVQGLRIQSDNNYVTQNNFIENNLATEEFVSYLDISGSNNVITGNYYDIWTWPDEDENDIVDKPYPIFGSETDSAPHVKVFQTDLVHILTRPRLIHPNESLAGEKFWGPIELKWAISSDTFGHDVTYNVSISSDSGSSWNELAHDLVETNIEWNSSEAIESAEYRFKVIAQCTNGLISEYTTGAEYEIKNHTLSIPTVITPNGGETIVGEFDITWNEAIESWGLPVTYRVSYSSDGGETWSEIIDYLEGTTLSWDVRGLTAGNEYLIRITATGVSGLISEDISDSVFTIARRSIALVYGAAAGGVVLVLIIIYAIRKRGAR
jgi:parallel beta-helix repeat protein